MNVRCVYQWLKRPEEGLRSPGAGVTLGGAVSHETWVLGTDLQSPERAERTLNYGAMSLVLCKVFLLCISLKKNVSKAILCVLNQFFSMSCSGTL